MPSKLVTDAPLQAPDDRRIAYIAPLDGVRGVAVAAVMFFHGGYLLGGFLSVDVFFVLSGFLITSLLIAEINKTGRIDLLKFWGRRARRLLPALFVMLAGVSLYAAIVASPADLNTIRGDALSTLFYFANWHAILDHRGYWTLFQSPSPLEHAWSLAIEEQFYLVWPLVAGAIAWFAARHTGRHSRSKIAPMVFATSLGLAALSPLLMWHLTPPGSDPSLIYVRTDTRVGTILLGAALAAWIAWRGVIKQPWARWALEVAGIVGAFGIAYAWVTVNGQKLGVYHGGFFLFDLCAVAVIAAAAHPKQGPIAHLLAVKPLRALGIISYGLYLWHWPVYVLLTPARTGFGGHPLLFVRIVVSLCCGIASYFLVEKPIRNRNLSVRKLVLAIPAAVAACTAAILLSTAGATAPASASAAAAFTSKPHSTKATEAHAAAQGRHAAAATPRVLIVGDSVGVNIGNAAEQLDAGSGLAVDNASIPGCLLAPATQTFEATLNGRNQSIPSFNPCEAQWLAAAQVFKPNVVEVIYGTGGTFLDPLLDNQFVSACNPTYEAWYQQHLSEVISQFMRRGASRVVLFKLAPVDNPNWPDDAQTRIDCVNAVQAQVARSDRNVTMLDLASVECPGGHCLASLDGVVFRDDGIHVTVGAPARYVAQWLLAATKRLTVAPSGTLDRRTVDSASPTG